jgi:hypothetical protein
VNYIDKLIPSDGKELPDNCYVCFHGTWAASCFEMLNYLAEKQIICFRVNLGEHPEVIDKYSILIYPTFISFVKGKEKFRVNGFRPKILNKLL